MKKENKDKLKVLLENLKPVIEQYTILKTVKITECVFYKPKYVLTSSNNHIQYSIQLKRNKLIVTCFGLDKMEFDRTFDNSIEGIQHFNILINALSKYVNLCNEIKQLETAYNITFCK
jgi:hypothetical protein